MNRGRRHANDFTDSLNSFQYTNSSGVNSDVFNSMSQDSLEANSTKNSFMSNDLTRSSKHSVILAGSSTKDSIMSNASISFVASVVPAPNLNKRIDLFEGGNLKDQSQYHVGFTHSCNKTDDNKENNNLQFRMKDKQLTNGVSKKLISEITLTSSQEDTSHSHEKSKHNILNKNSKRDTNHNIHNKKFNVVPVAEENVLKSVTVSQPSSLSNSTNKETPVSNMDGKHTQIKEELKFENILCFLDNQFNQIKEVSQPQQVLKRLSDKYVHAPKNFTERLLTIIEESVINNGDDTFGASTINLNRLTTEFRKMCKFIEDESTPEWPPSPLSLSPCPKQVFGSPTCNKSVHASVCTKEKSLTSPINTTSLPTTPLSGIDIIKRRFFQKISKNNFNGSIDNVTNLSSNISSTESFERLEAQCKRLFPEEKECIHPLRKSMSVPSLLSMTQIQDMCEQQMASLNISNAIDRNPKGKILLSTPNLLDACLYQSPTINKLRLSCAKLQLESSSCRKYLPDEKVSYSKTKSRKINRKSDSNEVNSDKVTYDYMTLDPDELEKTLLQDIAEKRKRCLDTARLITEINADPEVTERQKSLEASFMSTTNNETNSMSYDEAYFLKTLTSCKDYQTYLEKQKPLFSLLHTPNSCLTPKITGTKNERTDLQYEETKDSEKELLNVKQLSSIRSNISSPNVKPCDRYKSPLSKKIEARNKNKTERVKPKLFVTPGKTPPDRNYKKKKVYFPTMYSPVKNTLEDNILKSPHAEGLYRLNYNTIISPVGMYIRGTDMKLIKNVRGKTGGLLLSPVKKNIKTVPNITVQQATPLKAITKTQEKIPLNINLSPRLGTNQAYRQEVITSKTPEDDSTPKSHFVLPKVSYKLPLQVRTIKEDRSPKPGTRVKKLLESAHSKVVIRHQGRTNSIKKQKGSGVAENNEILEINYEPEDESIHIEQAASKTNFIQRQKNI